MFWEDGGIFYVIVTCICIEYVWEVYLDVRQKKVQNKNTSLPNELIGIISKETFEKSRLYAIDKRNFTLTRDTIKTAVTLIFLMNNGLRLFWDLSGYYMDRLGYANDEDNEKIQSVIFVFLLGTVQFLCLLPFCFYFNFIVEEKHGFNNQTLSFFIKDKLKSYFLQQLLSIPSCWGIVCIVKSGGDFFFLYLWLFVLIITCFIYTIYPDFIAPMFDKYIPLPPGDLRAEIEKFAKSLEFPLSDMYVVIGSKRSAHSNAYFYGFFKKKRIVLFDTLLKDFDSSLYDKDLKKDNDKRRGDRNMGCDNYEILAVLGHEMGHWKMSHNIKNLIIGEFNLLLVFVLFSKLFKFTALYKAFGFYNTAPVIIGLQIILHYVFTFYFSLIKFFLAVLGRYFEFQADKYAKSLGRAHYLKKALIKLNNDNLEFPIYDPLYSTWHNSHPPLLERIQALDKDD